LDEFLGLVAFAAWLALACAVEFAFALAFTVEFEFLPAFASFGWASVISIPGGIGRACAEAEGENCGKTDRMRVDVGIGAGVTCVGKCVGTRGMDMGGIAVVAAVAVAVAVTVAVAMAVGREGTFGKFANVAEEEANGGR